MYASIARKYVYYKRKRLLLLLAKTGKHTRFCMRNSEGRDQQLHFHPNYIAIEHLSDYLVHEQ